MGCKDTPGAVSALRGSSAPSAGRAGSSCAPRTSWPPFPPFSPKFLLPHERKPPALHRGNVRAEAAPGSALPVPRGVGEKEKKRSEFRSQGRALAPRTAEPPTRPDPRRQRLCPCAPAPPPVPRGHGDEPPRPTVAALHVLFLFFFKPFPPFFFLNNYIYIYIYLIFLFLLQSCGKFSIPL